MPYIHRNKEGEVMGLLDSPSDDNNEWLELVHDDVVAFLHQSANTKALKNTLHTSDAEMARVLEDVIDILMEKQVFVFTELPEAVQDKLNRRKKLRKDVNALSNLIGGDETIL